MENAFLEREVEYTPEEEEPVAIIAAAKLALDDLRAEMRTARAAERSRLARRLSAARTRAREWRRREIDRRLARSLIELENRAAGHLAAYNLRAAELAVETARAVVATELRHREALTARLERALAALGTERAVKVRAHPDTLAILASSSSQRAITISHLALPLSPDSSLDPGIMIIDCAFGSLSLSPASEFERLAEELYAADLTGERPSGT